MAQRGPPFDFDLNEPPPPEDDDGADDASGARAPEPVREPSPRDLMPPSPQDTVPPPQHDALHPPAPSTSPESSPLPAPVPEYSPRDPLPAPSPAPEPLDPLPAPVPESSPHDPVPSPAHEPSPRDPQHPPSPVLDLEAPLSSLDDDEDDYDYDEEELSPPPPLPPFGLPIAAVPARSSSSVDALLARPDGHAEPFGDTAARLQYSSPKNSAPRGASRSASGTASSHRSRRRPYSYDPRDDDAISKQRRVGSYDDDDAGSSRSGSRRSGSPRRYEHSELAPPPHYGQGGGVRRAPGTHGAPPRNRRRPQHGYNNQYPGPPIQKQQQQGRGREQGHRGGQERPQAHQGHHHGPHGPEAPKVGYSSYGPLSGSSFVRWGAAPDDDRQSLPEREPIDGNGGYHHQRREAPPFRPSSRPRGREDSYHGRQSQAQEPPKKTGGGYHHQRWEAPGLKPSAGSRGRDRSSGGRQQQPINGGAYQQRKTPRGGGEHFPDRPYHPYARDGVASGRPDGGHQARREPPPNYEHRRDSKQRPSGGPSRGRQYYGEVQERVRHHYVTPLMDAVLI